MARAAKPYKYRGWFCTSSGGVQHQKLCPVGDGQRQAELALARLLVQKDDAKRLGQATSPPGPGIATLVEQKFETPLVINPLVLNPQSALIATLCEKFLDEKAVESAPDTHSWYRDKLTLLFERYGARPVATITHEDGLAYKKYLMNEHEWKRGKGETEKTYRGLKAGTVNGYLRAAKTLLSWASKPSRRLQTGLTSNQWEEIKFLVEKPRERLITEEELDALLANCTDGNTAGGKQDFRDQLVVLRFTTMRPKELRLLRWEYISWESHRVVYPPEVIKTRKRREATMITRVEETLLLRKQRFEAAGMEMVGFVFARPGKGEDGKRSAGRGEAPVKNNSLSQRFRRLLLRCVEKGLIQKEVAGERIVPYSTRHTRITEMCDQGHTPQDVMFDAGHVVPATTERYKHLAGSAVADRIRSKAQQPADRG